MPTEPKPEPERVTVDRHSLRSLGGSLLAMVVFGVLGLSLFGVASCNQARTNNRLGDTNSRLEATVERLDTYIRDQLHEADLEAARQCVGNHVRYRLFKQIMTDLVGERPEVWQKYPSPPCDLAAAQALLDKG
jgi:hypothetical protein